MKATLRSWWYHAIFWLCVAGVVLGLTGLLMAPHSLSSARWWITLGINAAGARFYGIDLWGAPRAKHERIIGMCPACGEGMTKRHRCNSY